MAIIRLLGFLICLFLFSIPVFTQRLIIDNSFVPTINGSVNFVEILRSCLKIRYRRSNRVFFVYGKRKLSVRPNR
jgi:hypothetical protein